jgi:MFS family permease
MMIAGQFICGLMQGIWEPISRMYLAETTHPTHRGLFMSGTFITTLAYQLIIYVAALWLNWQQLGILSIVLTVIVIPFLMMVPESHVWLVASGRKEEAKQSLQWFYGDHYDIEHEFNDFLDHYAETKKAISSWRDIFRFVMFAYRSKT